MSKTGYLPGLKMFKGFIAFLFVSGTITNESVKLVSDLLVLIPDASSTSKLLLSVLLPPKITVMNIIF